jgi:hypothetical protein
MRTDPEIQNMLDIADNKLKEAMAKLGQISNPDVNTKNMILQLSKSIVEASSHIKEQQEWLKVYFSKGKSKRKSMFYERKITWFGLPLN